MIYIIDDFLPINIFNKLEKYLINFQEVKTTYKSFWALDSPKEFTEWISNKISLIENKEINNILSFFRLSNDTLDTDWRIHCDSIINDQLPTRAVVLYFSNSVDSLNGTGFWAHETHGEFLPYDKLTTEEYNNLILKDANNIEKWKLKSIISQKKNRLISYPSNYFHSKYPNISSKYGRKIFVMFYN